MSANEETPGRPKFPQAPSGGLARSDRSGGALKDAVLRLERWTTGAAMVGACAMLALASGLGLFQIFTRFVIERPAEWTEVLIRFSLIWMVFLGIPMAFRQGAMVSVDVLYRWAGPGLKRGLDAAVCLAALALVAVLIVWGWDYAQRGKVQTVTGLEDASMFWAYLALPVGGAFSVLGIVANWLDPQRLELETAQ